MIVLADSPPHTDVCESIKYAVLSKKSALNPRLLVIIFLITSESAERLDLLVVV